MNNKKKITIWRSEGTSFLGRVYRKSEVWEAGIGHISGTEKMSAGMACSELGRQRQKIYLEKWQRQVTSRLDGLKKECAVYS